MDILDCRIKSLELAQENLKLVLERLQGNSGYHSLRTYNGEPILDVGGIRISLGPSQVVVWAKIYFEYLNSVYDEALKELSTS